MVGDVVSPRVLIVGMSVLAVVTLAIELFLDAPTALIAITLITMLAIGGIIVIAWRHPI